MVWGPLPKYVSMFVRTSLSGRFGRVVWHFFISIRGYIIQVVSTKMTKYGIPVSHNPFLTIAVLVLMRVVQNVGPPVGEYLKGKQREPATISADPLQDFIATGGHVRGIALLSVDGVPKRIHVGQSKETSFARCPKGFHIRYF